jgi:polyhydroxyalkanoate synthesis regulator phasin
MDEDKTKNLEGLTDGDDTTTEDKDKKFDYSYVKELREEAKKYREDKAKLRADFEKIQKQLKEIEDAKLTDSEKDKKKISELEKQLVDVQNEYKSRGIENLIIAGAAGRNFIDIDAVKIFALKELASEDDIDEKAVGKVLDKIAKDKPYLVKADEAATANSGNFGRQEMDGKTDEQKFAEWVRTGRVSR